MGKGRGGDEEPGEGRGGPIPPGVGGAKRPDAAGPRAQECAVRPAGWPRRRAPERRGRGGAAAGTTPPPPIARRAPPRRLGPFRPRFGAARLSSRPSLPPSFPPPQPGARRAREGELAAAPSARPLPLTWAPAPSPASRPANPSQVRGCPGRPRTRPSPSPLDSWCLHVPPPPRAAGASRLAGEWGCRWRGPRAGSARSEVQEMRRADWWPRPALVPRPP